MKKKSTTRENDDESAWSASPLSLLVSTSLEPLRFTFLLYDEV